MRFFHADSEYRVRFVIFRNPEAAHRVQFFVFVMFAYFVLKSQQNGALS